MRYLNARPLIEGLAQYCPSLDVDVREAVPADLIDGLLSGACDVALCPTIDYFRHAAHLHLLPVGGIGCLGPTLTVRLFSRTPLEEVSCIATDLDSHTSVALLQILCQARLGRIPPLHPLVPDAEDDAGDDAPCKLLIGDKVLTHLHDKQRYPWQLDLGEAWHAWTGMPFVFAIWMTRLAPQDPRLGLLSEALTATRATNTHPDGQGIAAIVRRRAAAHGWPAQLARDYLGRILCYETGPAQLAAIERFGQEAAALGLCPLPGPLRVWTSAVESPA